MIWTRERAMDAASKSDSTGKRSLLRRDFGKAALGAIASTALGSAEAVALVPASSEFPKVSGLTDYVSKFVAATAYSIFEDKSRCCDGG